ncbi:Helix-turn-helix domain containing protein [uncultured Caudovirales phage]|uniref:Helix-turn-helix domain containing protein n=1 Tax=uncultured Caudovirales phage TaxID=2100421 RepID=A0A6J5KTK1_9CAUD|nr:Helix-turn-helix domain containing protein [uncultured Caudovirales phage]
MSEDLMFHMADTACVRAWEDEGWGPYHKRLLTMCIKTEMNGWKRKTGMTQVSKIINHMQKNGSITQREAYIDYGVQSFHRRLTEIKDAGYKLAKVAKVHPTTGQHYSRYYIEGQHQHVAA